jgi:hypothetical protein
VRLLKEAFAITYGWVLKITEDFGLQVDNSGLSVNDSRTKA